MSVPSKNVEGDYATAGFYSDRPEAWHDFLPGVKRRVLVNNSAATAAMFRVVPGGEVPVHSHSQSQYGVCLEGSGVFTVGDRSWRLKKGDSYYIPPSVRHGVRFDPGVGAVLVEFFTPMRREMLRETFASEGP
ncbi:MAG: cupin domain-containing protein [Nitrososphaerota archaeon]|nr:cupin domain-containing protein [Nitrososphaerota archaeon]